MLWATALSVHMPIATIAKTVINKVSFFAEVMALLNRLYLAGDLILARGLMPAVLTFGQTHYLDATSLPSWRFDTDQIRQANFPKTGAPRSQHPRRRDCPTKADVVRTLKRNGHFCGKNPSDNSRRSSEVHIGGFNLFFHLLAIAPLSHSPPVAKVSVDLMRRVI
jgi:hypothetical protein